MNNEQPPQTEAREAKDTIRVPVKYDGKQYKIRDDFGSVVAELPFNFGDEESVQRRHREVGELICTAINDYFTRPAAGHRSANEPIDCLRHERRVRFAIVKRIDTILKNNMNQFHSQNGLMIDLSQLGVDLAEVNNDGTPVQMEELTAPYNPPGGDE